MIIKALTTAQEVLVSRMSKSQTMKFVEKGSKILKSLNLSQDGVAIQYV